MRYITNQHPDHEGVWCVCEDGAVLEVLADADRSQAISLLAAGYDWQAVLTAGGDAVTTWEADPAIAYEGIETSDHRVLEAGSLSTRALPVPLMWQTETSFGHDGAVIAGAMDSFERRNNGQIYATGRFDTGMQGTEAARLVGQDIMRGVSIDLADADVTTEILATDDDGWPTEYLDHFNTAELMGLTGTPFPAFADARIRLTSDLPAAGDPPAVAAAGGPVTPPVVWFLDPELTEPTALTITDDGRVYGHLAVWGTCHIGRADACVSPPTSPTQYAYFATGVVHCDDGCEVPTGVLTFNTGHASLGSNHREAAAHYDNTGAVGADIAVGEDAFGIWCAGALRSDLTDEQIRALRSSAPSGDWRSIGGNLEMVAVLAVNVPGFPVPRTQARVASGQQLALVAAAGPRTPSSDEGHRRSIERRLETVERVLSSLRLTAARELDERMSAPVVP